MNKYEVQELQEIDKGVDELNLWFKINTIATIFTGIGALILSLILLFK